LNTMAPRLVILSVLAVLGTTCLRTGLGFGRSVLPRSCRVRSRVLFSEPKGFGQSPPPKPQQKKTKKRPADTTGISSPVRVEAEEQPQATPKAGGRNLDGLSLEERQDAILASFGLSKAEEASPLGGASAGQPARAEEVNFSPINLIPLSVQGSIEQVLLLATGLLLTVFVVAGIGITWDAYAISTKGTLPDSVKPIITEVLEPNFTVIGVLFLACSSSLGLFKLAQLSDPGASYREEDN